jgi:hypothetical protein
MLVLSTPPSSAQRFIASVQAKLKRSTHATPRALRADLRTTDFAARITLSALCFGIASVFVDVSVNDSECGRRITLPDFAPAVRLHR